MTTGQDMSEKMITTDETWEKLKQFGIEKIRNFAESEGIRREISRNGLTERETRELIRQYRKKADKRRVDSFLSKKRGTKAEIQRVYENGRRDSEKDRTQGKFSLKSLDSSSLDTVEIILIMCRLNPVILKIGLEIGKITRVKQVKL